MLLSSGIPFPSDSPLPRAQPAHPPPICRSPCPTQPLQQDPRENPDANPNRLTERSLASKRLGDSEDGQFTIQKPVLTHEVIDRLQNSGTVFSTQNLWRGSAEEEIGRGGCSSPTNFSSSAGQESSSRESGSTTGLTVSGRTSTLQEEYTKAPSLMASPTATAGSSTPMETTTRAR